jgi:glycosyltransferase involved in cell wall biosynthesis
VPPSDPAGLAAALDEVLGAPLTARRMGVASRRRAPDFHWDALAARVLSVYDDVVSEASPRPLAAMYARGA